MDPNELKNPSLAETIVTAMSERPMPGVSQQPVERSEAPTVGARSADRLAQGSGIRTQPGGQHGADVPAPTLDGLTNNIMVGPYRMGSLLGAGNFDQLTDVLLLVGSAANVVFTGWIVNSVAQRPMPLDPFGLMVSGLSQAGMGAVLGSAPATKSKK